MSFLHRESSPLDRTKRPAAGPLRPFHVPAVERHRLPGGLPVHVVRQPHLPVVTAAFVLPAGEGALNDAQAGLAGLTADALEGGTKRRSGSALAEALEAIGADASASSGWDSTIVSLSCLSDRLDEGLDLLVEMLLAPAFDEIEVARVRDQQLARLRQRASDPSSLAADRSVALWYADGEPYRRTSGGSEEVLAAVDASTLRAFAQRWYRPAGAGLVLVGDVDSDEVLPLAERLLAGWEGEPPALPAIAGAPRFIGRSVHVIDRPGSVQSELRIGQPGTSRNTPDHAALVVANAVLGGTFTSRLNLNLRERNGFTYGVRSRFAFRRGPGPFSISTAVDTDVTASAVREALFELDRFVAEGPREDELVAVRDYIAGVFPLQLETTGQVAGRVAELLIYGLPDSAWVRYRDDIRAVDVEAAHRAFGKVVHPEQATIVVVGDAERVRPELEALAIGPVTVHPADTPSP